MRNPTFLIGAFFGAATIALTGAANAEILPHTFAREFCELRALGLDFESATATAAAAAYIHNPNEIQARGLNGKMMPVSVLLSTKEALKRCPYHYPSQPAGGLRL